MHNLIRIARNFPWLYRLIGQTYAKFLSFRFKDSSSYWINRYKKNGDSGAGSSGKLSKFKAEMLNRFVDEHHIASVIEFGCGDGNQLRLANYPSYLGVDISEAALSRCKTYFGNDPNKRFALLEDYRCDKAELALSLDVIYHLTEEAAFTEHMSQLFNAATRYVIIYSSNRDTQDIPQAPHVRHRKFTDWVEDHAKNWTLIQHIPNRHPSGRHASEGSFADFFIFSMNPDSPTAT